MTESEPTPRPTCFMCVKVSTLKIRLAPRSSDRSWYSQPFELFVCPQHINDAKLKGTILRTEHVEQLGKSCLGFSCPARDDTVYRKVKD